MALLWIDGFDHYNGGSENGTVISADEIRGCYQSGQGTNRDITNSGIHGLSFRLDQVNASGVFRFLDTPVDVLGTGCYFSTPGVASGQQLGLIGTQDSSGTNLFCVSRENDGTVTIRSGAFNGSTLATSSGTLVNNTVYHLEIKWTIDSSVGSIEVRIDGSPFVTYSGNTGTTSIGRVYLGRTANAGGQALVADDFYIWDDSGTVNNDWLGERQVYTLRPSANGSPMDWAVTGGGEAFEALDNLPPSGTNYISEASVNDRAVFALDDLPTTQVSIAGIQTMVWAQKDGAGTSDLEYGIITNSVEESDVIQPTNGEWSWYTQIVEQNPDTVDTWQPGQINALEAFVERAA